MKTTQITEDNNIGQISYNIRNNMRHVAYSYSGLRANYNLSAAPSAI